MTYRLIFLLATLSCLFLFEKAAAQTLDTNFVDGVVYVKITQASALDLSNYDNSIGAINFAIANWGIDSMTRPFPGLNDTLNKTYRIHFNQFNKVEQMLTMFKALSVVEYAEKAPIYRTSFTPNDLHGSQWALKKVEAEKAWNISTGKASIVIAIVDNGVNINHEDLKANIWVNSGEVAGNGFDDDLNGYTDDVNGYDVADGDGNPNPPSGISQSSPFVHGTLCAGIAGAVTNNNKGVASLGYSVKIMAVKCSANNASDEGKTITSAYDGVYYAIRAGADIISLSWGGSGGIFITGENIVRAADQVGIVVVAAAGNSNTSEVFYPAGYNTVIAVGASDQSDKRANFSNYGSYIDVMAPGVSIYTTNASTNSAYSTAGGTSMSCPLTASLCGLILSQQGGLSPSAVKSRLKAGADNIDGLNSGFEGKLGAGRINAYKTLNGSAGVSDIVQIHTENPMYKGSHFVLSHWQKGMQVQAFDAMGRSVELILVDDDMGKFMWDRSISTGFYLLRVFNPSSQSTIKVFVYE